MAASVLLQLFLVVLVWDGGSSVGSTSPEATSFTRQLPYNVVKNLNTEQHLIVDWTRFYEEAHVISMLSSHGLKVEQVLHIHPIPEDYRLNVLSAFYTAVVKSDALRGAYPFTVYVVRDYHPHYEYRVAGAAGLKQVNVNMFEVKQKFRNFLSRMPVGLTSSLGQGFHATDHISETKTNLKALGMYDNVYEKRSFEDMREVFDALNNVPGLCYVVLRNFENLPDNASVDEHMDVDLLVSDYFLAKRILDGDGGYSFTNDAMLEDGGNRVMNLVKVGGQDMPFDLRHVGDNYFDISMQRSILNDRVPYKNFFVPSPEHLLYSMLYHALVHKPVISNTYKTYFEQNGVWRKDREEIEAQLMVYLEKNNFRIVPPHDHQVGFKSLTFQVEL